MGRAHASERALDFGYIPDWHGDGRVHLTIYPPGTFFGRAGYSVHVGGSGVGQRRTLRAARKLLAEAAKTYCQRRVDEAERIAAHYTAQRGALLLRGIDRP